MSYNVVTTLTQKPNVFLRLEKLALWKVHVSILNKENTRKKSKKLTVTFAVYALLLERLWTFIKIMGISRSSKKFYLMAFDWFFPNKTSISFLTFSLSSSVSDIVYSGCSKYKINQKQKFKVSVNGVAFKNKILK